MWMFSRWSTRISRTHIELIMICRVDQVLVREEDISYGEESAPWNCVIVEVFLHVCNEPQRIESKATLQRLIDMCAHSECLWLVSEYRLLLYIMLFWQLRISVFRRIGDQVEYLNYIKLDAKFRQAKQKVKKNTHPWFRKVKQIFWFLLFMMSYKYH